jgi:hypothetical protein
MHAANLHPDTFRYTAESAQQTLPSGFFLAQFQKLIPGHPWGILIAEAILRRGTRDRFLSNPFVKRLPAGCRRGALGPYPHHRLSGGSG